MKQLLQNIQQYFIPKGESMDELELRKFRVLINVTLVTTLFAIFYLGSTILFGMPNVFVLMVVCSVAFFSNAFLLKFGVPRLIVANFYVAVVLVASIGVIYFTEGLWSFDMPWLALGPVCAILLDTGKRGWIWLIVALGITTYFGISEIQGAKFPMEMPLEYKGIMFLIALSGLITILFVITHVMNKTAEDSLNSLSEEKKKSDELLQIKDRFFAIISHDLRGPVSAFKGISDVMDMFIQNKRYDDLEIMSQEMGRSVNQISGLLDNLLNWASAQQGQIPYNPEKIDLEKTVDDLFATLKLAADSKNIDLHKDLEHEIQIWADLHSTMTIFRNLVGNALKFTPQHGEVTVKASKSDGKAIINVKDTGVGIPQDKLETLFQLKTAKGSFGTAGEKGVGLGLQLVKDFTSMNQGEVSVKSKEGEGTEFTLTLPLVEN